VEINYFLEFKKGNRITGIAKYEYKGRYRIRKDNKIIINPHYSQDI
jgi:hypothetical protein